MAHKAALARFSGPERAGPLGAQPCRVACSFRRAQRKAAHSSRRAGSNRWRDSFERMAKGIVEDGDAVGCLERGRQKKNGKSGRKSLKKSKRRHCPPPDQCWIAKSSRLRR